MKRKMFTAALGGVTIAFGLATGAAVILVGAAPAFAAPPAGKSFPIALHNVGDEPRAAGVYTQTPRTVVDYHFNVLFYSLDLTLSCTKLTPGATYLWYSETSYGERQVSFVANAKGKSGLLRTGFSQTSAPYQDWVPRSVVVYRVNGDNLIPVLAVSFP